MAPRQTPSSASGRALGPRALRTRQRLLEVTSELLRQRGILDLSVAEIARGAATSPATFYSYFRDVEEAALALAEKAARRAPELVALIEGPWEGGEGLERARRVARGFIDHWEQHRDVLSVRNMQAEMGDPRFQRVRRKALVPVHDRLAGEIRHAQEEGRVGGAINPYVAAAAMLAFLEGISAHLSSLSGYEVNRENFIETCARLVQQTLTGQAPAEA